MADTPMHYDDGKGKKRPVGEEDDSTQSNKRVTTDTGRVNALSRITISSPCKNEDTFQIKAEGNGPVYISGLMHGLKEGLAIAAHQDVPRVCTWSDECIAERIEQVREVLGALLANVHELVENLRKFSRYRETVSLDDLRDKLTYMLGATWLRFMGVDFPGSGQGTLQCFSCYYTLVAS